jgi:hypothetical protein|tara:strand:- start:1733 stop:2440 length:708 start_codon:yes stop_codon:yes gene_type:complete
MLKTAKQTKKKFYNKYIYKVSLRLEGAYALRTLGHQEILDFATGLRPPPQSDDAMFTTQSWRTKNAHSILKHGKTWISFLGIINTVPKNEATIRIETNILDVYTNNKTLYKTLCYEFSDITRNRHEPAPGMKDTLLDSNQEIFVKELPHSMYNYQVDLKTPTSLKYNELVSLAEWCKSRKPAIAFTDATYNWLLKRDVYNTRRWIYVDTESTLLMLRLRCNDLLGTVRKYIKTGK